MGVRCLELEHLGRAREAQARWGDMGSWNDTNSSKTDINLDGEFIALLYDLLETDPSRMVYCSRLISIYDMRLRGLTACLSKRHLRKLNNPAIFFDRSRCLQLSLSVCSNQGWVNTVDRRSIHTKHAQMHLVSLPS